VEVLVERTRNDDSGRVDEVGIARQEGELTGAEKAF